MHALRSFEREGKASIRHVQWEKLSKERQIEFCSDVDVSRPPVLRAYVCLLF